MRTHTQVTVPPGVTAGQPMLIQTPSGQQMQVSVPAGLSPGSIFQVAVPAPVAVATAVVAVAVAAPPTVVAHLNVTATPAATV
jgi:hypothetical protein